MTIITLSETGLQSADWQWHMRNAVRTTSELGRLLDLELPEVASGFPLLVPHPYIRRIQRGDVNDPLLRQVLVDPQENLKHPGYVDDPLNESGFLGTGRGMVQKYHGRALVIATGTCAINCRYCFRRHFPYQDHQAGKSDWSGIIDRVRADSTISEVILSGGDPLVLGDRQLQQLTSAIDRIPHVTTIRFHTRVPVVIPSRVCDAMIEWLDELSGKAVFVLHINHPNEIDTDLVSAIGRLAAQGVTLLNQSVLLRGVNDSTDTLIRLSGQLFKAGVLPYYLHLLDPVTGAQQFEVTEKRGAELIRKISASLPGYLVPRLVREVPGEASKKAIAVF